MSDKQMPECFCNEEAMASCDWEFNATLKYFRKGDETVVENIVDWKMANIPQLLAQAILQSAINDMNNRGQEIYIEWLRGCTDGEDMEVMTRRMMNMVNPE